MALPTFNHIHYTSLYDIVIYLDNTVAIIAIYSDINAILSTEYRSFICLPTSTSLDQLSGS